MIWNDLLDKWCIRLNIEQNIQDKFNAAGIEIMSLHFMNTHNTLLVFIPEGKNG